MTVPAITGITPLAGQLGNTVTITGTSLTGATAVSFGGAGGFHIVVNSATSVNCVVPKATSIGAVNVTITTPGGTSATFAWVVVGSTNSNQYYLDALKVNWHVLQNDAGIPSSGFTTGVPQSSVLNQMAFPAASGLTALAVTTAEEDTEWRDAHSGAGPIEHGRDAS